MLCSRAQKDIWLRVITAAHEKSRHFGIQQVKPGPSPAVNSMWDPSEGQFDGNSEQKKPAEEKWDGAPEVLTAVDLRGNSRSRVNNPC